MGWWRRVSLYFFMSLLLLNALSGCAADPVEDVVARVNGKNVTRQEVDEYVRLIYLCMPDLQGIYNKQGQAAVLEEEILWFLIEHKVLEQEVERLSLKIDEKELEQLFCQLREELVNYIYQSEENFLTRLEELRLTEEQLKLFPQGALLRELLFQHINSSITEEEARIFVQENKFLLEQPASVYAYRILLDNEQEAQKVLRLLEEGADFVETGEMYSRESFVELGQIRETDTFDPLFIQAAFQLEPGEISEPVKTPQGYFIIKITEKEEAVTLSFEQIKEDALQIVKEENYEQYFHRLMRDSIIETFKDNR